MPTSHSTARPPSLTSTVVWTAAIFAVAAAAWGARFFWPTTTVAPTPPPAKPPVVAQPVGLSPIELKAWRTRAWDKIVPRLDAADRAGEAAVTEKLASLDEFFRERRAGSQAFAEKVLSLSGKWQYVKSKLPTAEDKAHLQYLDEQFAKHIFSPADLQQALESSLGGYLSRLAGIEGQLLVDIRADLSDGALAIPGAPQIAASDEELRQRFSQLFNHVAAEIARDVPVTVSLTTVSFIGGEVAAQVAVRVAAAVASRLGVSAGVLGTGATSSWATFGLGLVAAVVVDVAIDKVAKAAGYDPVAAVTERVNSALNQVRGLLVDGDPEAVTDYAKLLEMARNDPDEAVRRECRRAATAIERSGRLGLRFEMLQWQRVRADVRRETLRRLILEEAT